MTESETKIEIIKAAGQAIKQLIKVAKEEIIIDDGEDEISADKLKNAAASKKASIFDAFEILERVENESESLKIEYEGAKDLKLEIVSAGRTAIRQLIGVAKEEFLTGEGDDISPEKLKNASASKKASIFDAFEILERIEGEVRIIAAEEGGALKTDTSKGFAEQRAGRGKK